MATGCVLAPLPPLGGIFDFEVGARDPLIIIMELLIQIKFKAFII